MHIILVSDRLATAKTLIVTPRMLLLTLLVFVGMVVGASFLFSYVSVAFRLPFVQGMVAAVQQSETQKTQAFVRDNLSAMAGRLGEMQAQLLQLDALGERISSLAGIKADDLQSGTLNGAQPGIKGALSGRADGRGGPLVLPSFTQPRGEEELQRELERLAVDMERRGDELSMLESRLMDQRIRKSLLPTVMPIKEASIGSAFGLRGDPVLGVSAMHEGIDFVAQPGTEVVSAAGGIVVLAERHPEYGNLIEIEHGNGFSTRYAHLSKMHVRAGQLVRRAQKIAASGNTGRSTGPHLHFEVRFNGVAQNPARFLNQGAPLPVSAATPRAYPARH